MQTAVSFCLNSRLDSCVVKVLHLRRSVCLVGWWLQHRSCRLLWHGFKILSEYCKHFVLATWTNECALHGLPLHIRLVIYSILWWHQWVLILVVLSLSLLLLGLIWSCIGHVYDPYLLLKNSLIQLRNKTFTVLKCKLHLVKIVVLSMVWWWIGIHQELVLGWPVSWAYLCFGWQVVLVCWWDVVDQVWIYLVLHQVGVLGLRKVHLLLYVHHRLWLTELSFFRVVEVLGCVVHKVLRRDFAGCLVSEVKVFVKWAASWTYSWANSRSLSLSFDCFEHFSGLWVEFTKRIDLLSWSMLHILPINCWSHTHISINNKLLRIAINFLSMVCPFLLHCYLRCGLSSTRWLLNKRNILHLWRLLAQNWLHFILVLLSENASSFFPFGNQVVRSCQVVEFVTLNVLFALFNVDFVVFLQKLHYFGVYWDLVFTYDYAVLFFWRHLVVPRVVSYVLYCVALGWIWVQNQVYQVFCVVRQKTGHFVVCLQNLLVQLLGVLIFKRQVAADHCVEDHTWRPNISSKPQVLLSLDHFWSCKAGTTTRSF